MLSVNTKLERRIMGTKTQPGPIDCYSAAPDEPVFIIRANDENAPDAVRHWATL